MLTGLGRPTTTADALARYCGHRWADCHRMIEEDLERRFDPVWLERQVDEAMAARIGDIVAIEGISDFLESQPHRALAIASSSDKAWLDSFLARLGLASHFGPHVYSAAGLARGKPHPDVYLMVAERLGLPPSSCLVIEDHPVGAAAGIAAGMTVIGLLAASHIRPGHEDALRAAGVRHIVGDYGEVSGLIKRLERP